jgi:hypothetical protein
MEYFPTQNSSLGIKSLQIIQSVAACVSSGGANELWHAHLCGSSHKQTTCRCMQPARRMVSGQLVTRVCEKTQPAREGQREKGDVRAFKYFRPGCVAKWSIIRSSTWASVSITHTHIQKWPPLVGLVGACTATFPIAM